MAPRPIKTPVARLRAFRGLWMPSKIWPSRPGPISTDKDHKATFIGQAIDALKTEVSQIRALVLARWRRASVSPLPGGTK